ncbi:MAG: NB-ARC domain-containing protein [Elainellaceae cyanobacterium]
MVAGGGLISQGFISVEEPLLQPGPLPIEKIAREGWDTAKDYEPYIGDQPIPWPPNEWAGREELLDKISGDWEDLNRLVVGLIGFGGEGKTSLARSWVYNRLLEPEFNLRSPRGIFYWDFYEKRSIDEFFEAAIAYLGAEDQLETAKSAHERASFLAGMLLAGPYVFILDGLEVIQYEDGEDYGILQNPDLRDFLAYFASGDHDSFCLITSRAPVIDLIEYITYVHRDVNRLADEDGRALLRYFLGDKPTDAQLNQTIEKWDGHALTLSLVGAYAREVYNKDLSQVDIDATEDTQPLDALKNSNYSEYYDRIRRILHRYDGHLTLGERKFLRTFSAFRLPVSQQAMDKVLKAEPSMIEQLVHYRILRRDSRGQGHTAHPLIRQYYFNQLKNNPDESKAVHRRIKEYYLTENLEQRKQNSTLQDLIPFIEAVHHLCRAGEYEQACYILSEYVDQGKKYVLTLQLGAYDTRLKLLSEFFPNGDLSNLPNGNQHNQYFILKETGFCLMALGRLREAQSFFQRMIQVAENIGDVDTLIGAYRDLASSHIYLGELAEAANVVKFPATSNSESIKPIEALNSLALKGWITHLRGELDMAEAIFVKLKQDQHQLQPDQPYLYGSRGIFYADYLHRIGRFQEARDVAEANLRISQDNRWLERESRCHRILGGIHAKLQNIDAARDAYNQALKIARRISHRPTLIETLRAQGDFLVQQDELDESRNDLNEAWQYASKGSYRIDEANIHISFAWLLLKEAEHAPNSAEEKRSQARQEANQAMRMSDQMGYYWGRAGAQDVLDAVN